jgi:hypothetical protein
MSRSKNQVKYDSRQAVEVAVGRRAARARLRAERAIIEANMENRGFEKIDTRRPSKYRAKKEKRAA